MDNKDLLAMKGALIQTTTTQGWAYIQKFSDRILSELEREAIDEDDEEKAKGLRRDAKGARKFAARLKERIDIAKAYTAVPEDQFLSIATGSDNEKPEPEETYVEST